MRAVILWESGVRTNAVPSSCPNSLKKSFNGFHATSAFRLSRQHNSVSFQCRRSNLILQSRPSSKWHTALDKEICEEHLGNFRQTALDYPNAPECRLLNSESCQGNIEAVCNVDDSDAADLLPLKHGSVNQDSMALDVPVSDTAHFRLLKLGFLFGSLTLQDTQSAVAASDFASGLTVNFFGDLGNISTGFASAFLLIFFSELGDKTFFIAALLAARNSAAVVFAGTFGALAIMTIISVVIGRTFHYIDEIFPFRFGETDLPVDDIAAVCLLVYYGVSALIDASSGDGLKAEDEQKEAELAVSEFSGNGAGILAAASTVISTFLLVFVAEWGDKSFFSTIALAAASSPLGVIGGALAGHGVATLIAVLGGSLLGTFLSEKVIAYAGGVIFLVFAGMTLIEIIKG